MEIKIFGKIEEVPIEWQKLASDIFLSAKYLKANEESTPKNYQTYYVTLWEKGQIQAISACQILSFNLSQVGASAWFLKSLVSKLKFIAFSFGNMMLTGNHAAVFASVESEQYFYTHIEEIAERIQKLSGIQRDVLVLKDFNFKEKTKIKAFLPQFSSIKVQPNMVLNIPENWENFENYLQDMRTKYRTRAKRALKKSANLKFSTLSLNEIEQYENEIYKQYQYVYENAKVKSYLLPKNYFYTLKNELKDDFELIAGFLDKKMVCFYTLIKNGRELESGFLGYDAAYLQAYALYQRMLYEMIAKGIVLKVQKIIFSRTALEIKSSVGAIPEEVFVFAKAKNLVLNYFLDKIVAFFYKKPKFEARNVFR
ncbi:hypothetical protein EQP59_07070 [Ornithobacterium rhinotracheale]|uniref:GNAT family N-acetyltransferase n=1 Tax=Ornithobacterium rhinotracheale TaxID=28251 RepID=A0A410JSK7_ORNRH|nr:peptidogalycan biosysnthesis protein [Ornithobacterium rhinotracheale]QAR31108.1 hypothetical protein EQP59_07070 [Ornithobacterium rhinotracheale]